MNLAVDLMNSSRPVQHVVIRPKLDGGYLISCDRCHVSSWHCAPWVDAAELRRRFEQHSKDHARCRP